MFWVYQTRVGLVSVVAWWVAALPIGEYTVQCRKFPHMGDAEDAVCTCLFIRQYGNY